MIEESQHISGAAIIILAAGKSSRLGKAKQLLPYLDSTLLQHTADTAIASAIGPVILVLGSGNEQIAKTLSGDHLRILVNKEWEEGMASSIRCGVGELIQHYPEVDGVIIMVCDQPFVRPVLLKTLLSKQQETHKPIVAAHYDGINGTPVIFHRRMFIALMELKGDKGARKILEMQPEMVGTIPFPEGIHDIDTETDYQKLEQWLKLP